MKLTLPLVFKLFSILLLFVAGLFFTAVLFPFADLFFRKSHVKNIRDNLKKQWLRWVSAVINIQVEQQGELPARTALVVSNHISWLDIVVLGRCLPPYFVAKRDILDWPVIGFLARQIDTVFIRRGDKQAILATAERMVWLLKQNSPIIAFPEGTTTNGDKVLGFHASLFQPAMLTKSLVQPVAIEYLGAAKALAPFVGDDEFIPHLLNILSLKKIEVRLSFLPAIDTANKSRQAVCNESRAAIIGAMPFLKQESAAQSQRG